MGKLLSSTIVLLVALSAGACGSDDRTCGSAGADPQCWVCPTDAAYDRCCGLLWPIRSSCEGVCVEAPLSRCDF